MGELEEYSVTVTVPIYNSSEFIDDCLKCISNQIYKVSEILFVVDERTTDDSEQKLEDRLGSFDNLRIIKQMDRNGLAGARNIGIREAKGNVIWFLDVDDFPHPTFLEEMLNIMHETNADTVLCNHFQSFKREIVKTPKKQYGYIVFDGKYAVEHYRDFPIYSWSRIQKKTVFNEESMFRNHPAAEDIEQTIRQYVSSNKVCYYDKPLYTYIKRKSSMTKNNRIKEIQSMEETAKSILPYVKEKLPESYYALESALLQNIMRQSTFSRYRNYSDGYDKSITHDLMKDISQKTVEMKIYSFSKLLYYLILFPFSHYFWDRKKGSWSK